MRTATETKTLDVGSVVGPDRSLTVGVLLLLLLLPCLQHGASPQALQAAIQGVLDPVLGAGRVLHARASLAPATATRDRERERERERRGVCERRRLLLRRCFRGASRVTSTRYHERVLCTAGGRWIDVCYHAGPSACTRWREGKHTRVNTHTHAAHTHTHTHTHTSARTHTHANECTHTHTD